MSGTLRSALSGRKLLLDGAMGSMIQALNLPQDLCRGNNDALVLLRPDVIADIHRQYLEAGADIITTCSFSAQRISQAGYGMADRIAELNLAAARLARKEADRATALAPDRPRFVLGDVGPTNRMLSMSDSADDPAARSLSFSELEDAYLEQIGALVDGGVDGILMETVFDTLNAKAGISAYLKAVSQAGRDVPLLISMTISDKSGRTLSGQTVEAFVTSVIHARPLCIGLNCGLGADGMAPYLSRMKKALSAYPEVFLSCHPNAGLPNQFGEYEQTPEKMAELMKPVLEENLCRVVGGCCGTTPTHIRAISALMKQEPVSVKGAASRQFSLSGLDAYSFPAGEFIAVGERCNVAGSRKFLKLIAAKRYDEALDIAREQISKGARVLDINMDDGMLDAVEEMCRFVNIIGSDPSVSRVPLMIDSSSFEVLEAGLECCQGKCIVNSISLKQGEALFLEQARTVRRLGAAVIVMCFDEQGQATDYERRIQIASRSYRLLTEEVGIPPEDIIFDPNILTIATGMEEHANYARDFIRATRWITENLPGVRVSGGLSNLSFAFRGNNPLREAMHSVFLHHAVGAGMGMAIMNPAAAVLYEAIDSRLRDALDAVILNSAPDAVEKLTAMAQEMTVPEKKTAAPATFVASNPSESLSKAILEGRTANLESDISELLKAGNTALQIISGPLMNGMNEVGRLFGEGRMFLPQVVRTARTMKRAVEILEPFFGGGAAEAGGQAGCIVLATVKGDVHDIGKNIVSVVLSCNGFRVIDLGVMVPAEKIVAAALDNKADIVCLSGLITPSLEEMCRTAEAMQRSGLDIPLFVGGATTSPLHTAVRIAPLYRGGVFHMKDAARNPIVAMRLLDASQRERVLRRNFEEQESLRKEHREKSRVLAGKIAALNETSGDLRYRCDWSSYSPVTPPYTGRGEVSRVNIGELVDLISWGSFFQAWKVRPGTREAEELLCEARECLNEMMEKGDCTIVVQTAFFPAKSAGDSIELNCAENGCTCCSRVVRISTPRQELFRPDGSKREECLAMSDFVSSRRDYVGVFACSVRPSEGEHSLLYKTLCDRLVEAAAELMSGRLKDKFGWRGIRPAVGYPGISEQSEIFKLAELLDFEALGIELTENGAMSPQSSICGLLIQNPEAKYFN